MTNSDAFKDRMDAVSGYPTHCAHGDPIPSWNGCVAPTNDEPLIDLAVCSVAALRRAKTDGDEKPRRLAELSPVPGASVEVLGRAPLNGPLRIHANGHEPVTGTELARSLRVEMTPWPNRKFWTPCALAAID